MCGTMPSGILSRVYGMRYLVLFGARATPRGFFLRAPSSIVTAPLSAYPEIFGLHLLHVYHREHEPVGEPRAEFLHEVEREARAARPVFVQEAHGGVKPHAFERRLRFVCEQAVDEGEHSVYRVERRAFAAPREFEIVLLVQYHAVERVEHAI